MVEKQWKMVEKMEFFRSPRDLFRSPRDLLPYPRDPARPTATSVQAHGKGALVAQFGDKWPNSKGLHRSRGKSRQVARGLYLKVNDKTLYGVARGRASTEGGRAGCGRGRARGRIPLFRPFSTVFRPFFTFFFPKTFCAKKQNFPRSRGDWPN